MNIQPATVRQILLTAVIATVLGGICPSLAVAQLANINPVKDNTLYQYDPAEGDVSNALGQHFFAGETGMGRTPPGRACLRHCGKCPRRVNDPRRDLEPEHVENWVSYSSNRRAAQDACRLGRRNIRGTWGRGRRSAGHDQRCHVAAPFL